MCSFKLNTISQNTVKTKVVIACFQTRGYLKCCNQAAVTDCVIADVVVVGTVGSRSPFLPDLDLYLENRTVVTG